MGNFFEDIGDALGDIFTWSPLKSAIEWMIPDPESPDRSIEIQRQGSDNPLPVVYGERVVGGIVVHKYVTGDNNEFLHFIVAFCHGPVNAVEQIFLNDRPIGDSEYVDFVTFETRQGTPTQTAIPAATSEIPNWSSDMRGRNVCYAWLRFLQVKDEQVWRGEPQVSARIRGREVYDWRTDTTSYSKNNAVCAVDYLTNPIYGRGLDSARINYSEWTAAADFCDESTSSDVTRTVCTVEYNPPDYRPTQNCTTQVVTESNPRYQLDAIVDTGSTVFDNFKELLSSFRGSPNRTNGLVGVSVETVGTPLVTFDDSTLVGGVEVSTAGLNNRYNRAIVRFPDKNSDNYQTNEAVYPAPGSQQYQDWLAEDNGKELTLETEVNTFATQSDAQQHAEIAVKRSRADKTVKFQARGQARLVVPNDIVGLTVGSYGWVNKPVRIVSRRELDNAVFEFEALEHQNAIYPWSGSSWSEQVGGTTLGTGVEIGAPTNLALAPDPTYATTGTLTWTLVNNSFVRYYEVEMRDGGDELLYVRTEYGPEHTVPLLAPGSYTVSVYAVSTIGRRSAEAALGFNLAIPVPPTDLGLIVSNNTIQSVPVLAGLNLGTQFEFDIVEGDGVGHTPESRIRARTGVFTGLIPSTEYTVFVRTLNALGASAWASETATTTANTAELDPVLENAPPFLALAERTENAFYELEIDRRGYEGTGVELISTETGFTLFKWGQLEQNNVFAYAIDEINIAIGPDGALAQSITAVGVRVTDAENNIVANADAIDEITARVGYCTLDGEPTGDEDRATCEANGGTWVDDAPLAESIRATRVEVASGEFATFSQIGQTYQDVDGTLVARGAVLTNVNGQVSGFVNVNDGTQSTFDVVADVFRVGVLDGGGAFIPKLQLEDYEGTPTMTLRGRLILADGYPVETVDSINARASFKSLVFRRANSQPATPTGGTYANPVPSGWSDGVPAGSAKLWQSTRVFTSDGEDPQQASWTTPAQLTDTETVEYQYSEVENSPGTPATEPGNWASTATVDTIWQAQRTILNGVAQAWVVYRVKGEEGADGAPGEEGEAGAGQYAGAYSSFTTDQATITSRFSAVTGRAPVFGDIFSQIGATSGSMGPTRYYDSTQWIIPPLLFVDGNLLATGTIAGNRLISNTVIQGPIFRTSNYSAGNSGIEINGQTGEIEINGSSGAGRLVLKNEVIEIYDSSSTLRVRLGLW